MWNRLAPIAHTGIQACDMRTKCCTSAQIAGGYIDRHLWREVDSPPWTLCSGDNVEENLRNFAADPTPVEHPMAKALKWLVGKWSMHQLVDLVVLLSLLHWSTLQTEQGHSSWSVMRRYHPTCFWQTLVCRAFCHMIRPLFRAAKEDKVVSKLRTKKIDIGKTRP